MKINKIPSNPSVMDLGSSDEIRKIANKHFGDGIISASALLSSDKIISE